MSFYNDNVQVRGYCMTTVRIVHFEEAIGWDEYEDAFAAISACFMAAALKQRELTGLQARNLQHRSTDEPRPDHISTATRDALHVPTSGARQRATLCGCPSILS